MMKLNIRILGDTFKRLSLLTIDSSNSSNNVNIYNKMKVQNEEKKTIFKCN